jgi:hypothetical protein
MDILSYARRFGVLGLCAQHNYPVGHAMKLGELAVFPGGPSEDCAPAGWPGECHELTDQWRKWSATFGTLLRLATALRMDQPGELEDWYQINPGLKRDRRFLARRRQGFWNGMLAPTNQILDLAPRRLRWGVDTGMRRIEDRLKPEMMPVLRLAPISHYAALWVALSAELAFAASGSRAWLTCSDCGRMYPARRTPTTGKLRFCSDCGKRAAWRAASRAYYDRRKGKKHDTQTRTR